MTVPQRQKIRGHFTSAQSRRDKSIGTRGHGKAVRGCRGCTYCSPKDAAMSRLEAFTVASANAY